jgi:DNA/RNA-binding domain of Phe-tRNA-synthetase-like protein
MTDVPSLICEPGLGQSVRVALIWGFDLQECAKTPSTPAYLSNLLERVCSAGETFLSPERKSAIRRMLRFGTYKPTGRAKPSSEYLLSAALNNEFPLVNGPVDINNAISLEWGYPASVFDMEQCGAELLLRRGVAGESYVFNPAGQIIDVKDLLCVCRKEGDVWLPCGNPVKDAMATKTRELTRNVVAVIYTPFSELPAEIESAASKFATLLGSECGASNTGFAISLEYTEHTE